VSVVGDFNGWDSRLHPMQLEPESGVWSLFIPEVGAGATYKYAVRTQDDRVLWKADPYGFKVERPPATATIVHRSRYTWRDDEWLDRRRRTDQLRAPMSIYEVHLESWRRRPEEDNRRLTYVELADELADYVEELGFTLVEFMPLMNHPFGGSWGYQVTGYFAPTPRLGEPDALRSLIDQLHERGIGVILDWVPGYFPNDEHALARFDGTPLYEHGEEWRERHPEWGTLSFDLGKPEVRRFLLSNALFWQREYHVDGFRVDAVASMLYLDYGHREGEWVPNEFGGREDLEAIAFLKQFNELVHGREDGFISAAEESTTWPGVSRPTYVGGLGFGFKWNMGWMHDTLDYFGRDPIHRRFHHHQLTFGMTYAYSENFILPLSHDEVVYGKRSLLQKMPGDRWQQLANLRALYGYMWAHPGRKLLFMGGELAQEREWNHDTSVDWDLLDREDHRGVQALVHDLNRTYRTEPALFELDFEPGGFGWLDANDADRNVIAFARFATGARPLVCICNFSPLPWERYRVGLPQSGPWHELLNTDSAYYGGSNVGNLGKLEPEQVPYHGQECSAELTLPPLATVWLAPVE
jgi:1,4-alpha-glucan branching enzyme